MRCGHQHVHHMITSCQTACVTPSLEKSSRTSNGRNETQRVRYLWAGRRANSLAGGTLWLAAGCQSPRQHVPRAAAGQQRHA